MLFPARLSKSRNTPMAMVLAFAILLGSCGGGGGSSSDLSLTPVPPPPPPDPFRVEYDRQGGLDIIKAGAMHVRGGTGNGITVAVFDSGSSDHPELSGKYVYESSIDIDCSLASPPPGETCTSQVVDPADTLGHGTFVTGIITASRNGEGILGVAYEAQLASVAISTTNLDDGEYPAWIQGLIPQIEKMVDLGALVTNNSWGTALSVAVPGPNLDISEFIPIDAYQAYVDAGGVQVWATGNESAQFPLVESAAPHYFPDLEKGWLAVNALGLDGVTPAYYSNFCGLTADWCIAAPAGNGDGLLGNEPYEGVTSTNLNGGYREWVGTSFAAPLVTAAIAALKSMFPNLTYHQIRDRILETADKGVYAGYPDLPTGIDSHEEIYGQGLLDLDAASAPVGGLSIGTSRSAYGPVVPIGRTRASLPGKAVDRYFAGRSMLVLDNYQRAPFWLPADTFAGRRGPQLAMSDLRLGIPEHDGSREVDYALIGFGGTDFWNDNEPTVARSVFGVGARVIEGMNAFTGVAGPRDGLYRMADDALGLAMRVASGAGGETFASFAANPTSREVGARTFGAAGWAPGAFAALTFVPQDAKSSVGLSAALALKRPMGWDGAGAFALSGDAFEVSYTREIASGDAYRFGFTGRLVHLETEAASLLRFEDVTMAAAEIDLSVALGKRTTLTAGLGMERTLTPAMGTLRLPSAIDASGRITFDEIEVDGSDFLRLDRGTLNLRYTPSDTTSLGAGLTVVRDGFDESDAIAGLQANFSF